MHKSLDTLLKGYKVFRQKYHEHDNSVMQMLSEHGQNPEIMVVACCDSRVDPAILFQCDPGQLFVVRNVANIIPPYEIDEYHHGTSAALEFAVCYLNVKHIVILGHSQCGGLEALANQDQLAQNDFITHWASLSGKNDNGEHPVDEFAKDSINRSYKNCLTFPWLKDRYDAGKLSIHRWFFNIKNAEVQAYCEKTSKFDTIQLDE